MVPGKQVLVDNPFVVTPFRPSHFTAFYRLATRPYPLTKTPAANTRTQFATVYHVAAATKTVRIRKVSVWIESVGGAVVVMAELVGLSATTAPATGNPAITPFAHGRAATAEAVCLALPTTPGVEAAGSPVASIEFNLNTTGAASQANPPPPLTEVALFRSEGEGEELPTMRAGHAEGYAVVVDASAARAIDAYVRIEFSEE